MLGNEWSCEHCGRPTESAKYDCNDCGVAICEECADVETCPDAAELCPNCEHRLSDGDQRVCVDKDCVCDCDGTIEAMNTCERHRQKHDSCNTCPHFMEGGGKCLYQPGADSVDVPQIPWPEGTSVDVANEAVDAWTKAATAAYERPQEGPAVIAAALTAAETRGHERGKREGFNQGIHDAAALVALRAKGR